MIIPKVINPKVDYKLHKSFGVGWVNNYNSHYRNDKPRIGAYLLLNDVNDEIGVMLTYKPKHSSRLGTQGFAIDFLEEFFMRMFKDIYCYYYRLEKNEAQ